MSEKEVIDCKIGWTEIHSRMYFDKRDLIGYLCICENNKTSLKDVIKILAADDEKEKK